MRGKAGVGGYTLVTGGITPAHAGKRNSGNSIPRHGRDHPRTRGEKPSSRQYARADLGSPPHTRGKVMIFSSLIVVIGITPAHAGKRSGQTIREGGKQDHPRTRGEKPTARRASISAIGSPPHTRGKARTLPSHRQPGGITPAHAGKSIPPFCTLAVGGDHPRTRGEKHLAGGTKSFL